VISRRLALGGLGAALITARAGATNPVAAPEVAGALIQGGWARGKVVGRPSLSLDGQALTYDADGSFFSLSIVMLALRRCWSPIMAMVR
jgi:hypothetical protein